MTNYANVDYAAITINDKNPLKRWLQNKRLNHSLLNFLPTDENVSVLDFGSGDGELCLRINGSAPNANIVCFEPSESLSIQAEKKISLYQNIQLTKSTSALISDSFDFIFCLEVFEHLPTEIIIRELSEFKRLLKPSGKLVIGVPNEIYFAALFKGGLRIRRRYGSEDAKFSNIFKAALGVPPKEREVINFDGLPYILRHIGFDHRSFKNILSDHFKVEKNYGSPFPKLALLFNLEVYFVCGLKK